MKNSIREITKNPGMLRCESLRTEHLCKAVQLHLALTAVSTPDFVVERPTQHDHDRHDLSFLLKRCSEAHHLRFGRPSPQRISPVSTLCRPQVFEM
jgi:hypothetical protein